MMPFKSKRQYRLLGWKYPEVFKKFKKHDKRPYKDLPEKIDNLSDLLKEALFRTKNDFTTWFGDHLNLQILKNPSRIEVRYPYARGWVAPDGTLYVSASDPEKVIHVDIVNMLKKNLKIPSSIDKIELAEIVAGESRWLKNPCMYGLPVERVNDQPIFKIGESFHHGAIKEFKEDIQALFRKAETINKSWKFRI